MEFKARLAKDTIRILCGRKDCRGCVGWVFSTPARGTCAHRWATDTLIPGNLPEEQGGPNLSGLAPSDIGGKGYARGLYLFREGEGDEAIAVPPGFVRGEDRRGPLFRLSRHARQRMKRGLAPDYRNPVRLEGHDPESAPFKAVPASRRERARIAPVVKTLPARVECPECGGVNTVEAALLDSGTI